MSLDELPQLINVFLLETLPREHSCIPAAHYLAISGLSASFPYWGGQIERPGWARGMQRVSKVNLKVRAKTAGVSGSDPC